MLRGDTRERCAIYTLKSSEEGLEQELKFAGGATRSLRGLHPQPARRGLGIGQNPL